ncbi:hypothetical protein AVDCRST_MAG81-5318 [uncultured Synechococcales cyanobacterium]|uniref:Uncharacterized protein n=1 Tax=uncultured Synechococcales cyanobacterium TaxID=1936017 RepID=A0A6N3IPL0_9CYAN|nr:hypothetical protein AVDCRST_MAG81-5318 [uncultured Synechococcales cyanobacterium]
MKFLSWESLILSFELRENSLKVIQKNSFEFALEIIRLYRKLQAQ